MKVSEYIEDWGRQKSDSTVYSHSKVLHKFDEEVGLKEATKNDIYDWLDKRIENSLKKTTANQYVQIFKSFYRWYRDNLPIPVGEEELREVLENQKRYSRIINMDRYRAADSTKKPIPKDVFLKLLEESEETERYWWYLLGYFGFRKGEFYSLKCDDVDIDDRSLHIRAEEVKTYKERTLYYSDFVADMLEEMINSSDSSYVLGFEADRNFFNRRLNVYDDVLDFHVTPHAHRHMFVHNIKQQLNDDLLVKWLVGHQTANDMTGVYSKPIEEISREAMTKKHYYRKWGIENGL